jgi:beta-phosphoglucomutase family hydrolase
VERTPDGPAPEVPRLPPGIRACLFDLDGVLTRTATVHQAAWKQTFDAFLRRRAEGTGQPFVPFSAEDYEAHVDGRLRLDGVRTFLASRGIVLPEGGPGPGDGPGGDTVEALGERKNRLVLQMIRRGGVEVYEGSRRFLLAARDAGYRRAVVSASRNAAAVLAAARLDELVEVRIDGETAAAEDLPGKPAPDLFLAAAHALGVDPSEGAVFEDAVAGVEAGRAGGFGWVVGVDRTGHPDELRDHGADVVVADLAELLGPA